MCTFAGISFTKLMSIIALNMAVNACGFVIYSMDVNSMNVNAAAGLEIFYDYLNLSATYCQANVSWSAKGSDPNVEFK